MLKNSFLLLPQKPWPLCEKTNIGKRSGSLSCKATSWCLIERGEKCEALSLNFAIFTLVPHAIKHRSTKDGNFGWWERQPQTPFSLRVRRHVPPSAAHNCNIHTQMEIKRCARACDNYADFVLQRRLWQSAVAFQRLFSKKNETAFSYSWAICANKGREKALRRLQKKLPCLNGKSSEFFLPARSISPWRGETHLRGRQHQRISQATLVLIKRRRPRFVCKQWSNYQLSRLYYNCSQCNHPLVLLGCEMRKRARKTERKTFWE